mgnify:CR=1 FL=1
MFPSMEDMMSSFDMNAMPQEMLEAFNISSMATLATVEGFFGYYFQYILIASAIFAAMLGTNALVREESEGTIQYLYAQPISRTSIVGEKMLANIVLYTLYWLAIIIVSFFACVIFKDSETEVSDLFSNFSLLTLSGWIMGMTFLHVGFLFSALLSSKKSTTSLSLGFVFLTFILGIVGKLQEDFQPLLYFSPIEAATPTRIFQDVIEGKYMLTDIIVLFLCCLATFWIYQRKDMKV